MARKTKQDALETRNRILDTAERVFIERGVSRTTLSAIAAASGLSRGAIYWHFKNKIDLFDAMMARVTLPIEEMLDQPAALRDDPLAHIRLAALNVLHRTAQDAQCRRVFEIVMHKCEFVDEMLEMRQRISQSRDGCLQKVEQGLQQAVRKGQLPKTVKSRQAAIGLHALIDGLIANWVMEPSYFSLANEGERMVDIYLNGLRFTAPPGEKRRRPKRLAATTRIPERAISEKNPNSGHSREQRKPGK